MSEILSPDFTQIVIGMPIANGGAPADASASSNQAVGLSLVRCSVPGVPIRMQKDGYFQLDDWTPLIGSSKLTAGSTYYLSATAGKMTTTAPTPTNITQRIGRATSSDTLALEFETVLSSDADVLQGTRGASRSEGQIGELITLSTSGLTTDSAADLLPANAVIEDVVYRIETSITGGTKAKGTITLTGLPVADETFVVGAQTFTWKASRSVTGEVTIGGSAAAACTNIIAAVNADLATVVASQGAGTTVIITAATGGVAGNSITFTESSSNLTVNGSGTLGATTSGVDADSFKLGDATVSNRFLDTTLVSVTSGVASKHIDQSGTSGPRQANAAKLRVTMPGIPQAGAIFVEVFYRSFVAPTS